MENERDVAPKTRAARHYNKWDWKKEILKPILFLLLYSSKDKKISLNFVLKVFPTICAHIYSGVCNTLLASNIFLPSQLMSVYNWIGPVFPKEVLCFISQQSSFRYIRSTHQKLIKQNESASYTRGQNSSNSKKTLNQAIFLKIYFIVWGFHHTWIIFVEDM